MWCGLIVEVMEVDTVEEEQVVGPVVLWHVLKTGNKFLRRGLTCEVIGDEMAPGLGVRCPAG